MQRRPHLLFSRERRSAPIAQSRGAKGHVLHSQIQRSEADAMLPADLNIRRLVEDYARCSHQLIARALGQLQKFQSNSIRVEVQSPFYICRPSVIPDSVYVEHCTHACDNGNKPTGLSLHSRTVSRVSSRLELRIDVGAYSVYVTDTEYRSYPYPRGSGP